MGFLDWLTTPIGQRPDPEVLNNPTPQPPQAAPESATGPLTADILALAGVTEPRISRYLDLLNAAMAEFDVATPMRAACFLAQVAYESEDFKAVEEIWGPTSYQLKYPGGQQYKGRGLIQITGQANYNAVAAHFALSDVAGWLVTPEGACRSAAWWWQANGCNALADAGNFTGLTRRINGPGMLGLADRLAIYKAVAPALGVEVQ